MYVAISRISLVEDGDVVCIVRDAQESLCGILIKEGY